MYFFFSITLVQTNGQPVQFVVFKGNCVCDFAFCCSSLFIAVYTHTHKIHSCEDTPSVKIYVHDHVTLSGDILVRLSDTDTSSLNANKNKREIFHLIFHTSCLVQQQQQQQQHLHTFGRSELDCLGKRYSHCSSLFLMFVTTPLTTPPQLIKRKAHEVSS